MTPVVASCRGAGMGLPLGGLSPRRPSAGGHITWAPVRDNEELRVPMGPEAFSPAGEGGFASLSGAPDTGLLPF